MPYQGCHEAAAEPEDAQVWLQLAHEHVQTLWGVYWRAVTRGAGLLDSRLEKTRSKRTAGPQTSKTESKDEAEAQR